MSDFRTALQGTAWHVDLTQVSHCITAVQDGTATDLYLDPSHNTHGSMPAALDGLQTGVGGLLAHNSMKVTCWETH